VSTVNTHRTNLMQKLDIHETAGLVRYAIQIGLVDVKGA
jgi:DNA-binding NarL/FixJ family response regulator